MNPISTDMKHQILSYFPKIELSYETHKKVFNHYDIILAIPQSKKYIVWFSYFRDKDTCFLIEFNKDKIENIYEVETAFHPSLSLGTILYGHLIDSPDRKFIITDILYYKGINMKQLCFGERLGFIEDFFNMNNSLSSQKNNIAFYLVAIKYHSSEDTPNKDLFDKCDYIVHHYQYRSLTKIVPYVNDVKKHYNDAVIGVSSNAPLVVSLSENKEIRKDIALLPVSLRNKCDYSKIQYDYKTIFQAKADIQSDIYHLFIYGKNNAVVYYDVAYIPNYKTSVFMNKIFRKIKENTNLDNIEESDDEEEFEDVSVDKYVDLTKVACIECIFNKKFRRWTPVREVSSSCKIVHISKLVRTY
jgi:hypothetical protein